MESSHNIKIIKSATAVAAPNIAMLKYWGKLDKPTNLPLNSSLSITLKPDIICTKTTIRVLEGGNGVKLMINGVDAKVTAAHNIAIDFFTKRFPELGYDHLSVESINNFPTSAGMASSASGLACLILALADLYNYFDEKPDGMNSYDYIEHMCEEIQKSGLLHGEQIEQKKADRLEKILVKILDLSSLSRNASGSSPRSLFKGFAMVVGPEFYLKEKEIRKSANNHEKAIFRIIDIYKRHKLSTINGESSEDNNAFLSLMLSRYFPDFTSSISLSSLRSHLLCTCLSFPASLILSAERSSSDLLSLLTLTAFLFTSLPKGTSSTVGMQEVSLTSPYLQARVSGTGSTLRSLLDSIEVVDTSSFVKLASMDSDSLHSVCAAAWPPVQYLDHRSHRTIEAVHQVRNAANGDNVVGYSFDAGCNAFVLGVRGQEFVKQVQQKVREQGIEFEVLEGF